MNEPVRDELYVLLKRKFPGMEYYFVNPPYRKTKNNKHIAHVGFTYCGFIDSFSEPHAGRIFRSTSYTGLLRLVEAEDPNFTPNIKEGGRKRFEDE